MLPPKRVQSICLQQQNKSNLVVLPSEWFSCTGTVRKHKTLSIKSLAPASCLLPRAALPWPAPGDDWESAHWCLVPMHSSVRLKQWARAFVLAKGLCLCGCVRISHLLYLLATNSGWLLCRLHFGPTLPALSRFLKQVRKRPHTQTAGSKPCARTLIPDFLIMWFIHCIGCHRYSFSRSIVNHVALMICKWLANIDECTYLSDLYFLWNL